MSKKDAAPIDHSKASNPYLGRSGSTEHSKEDLNSKDGVGQSMSKDSGNLGALRSLPSTDSYGGTNSKAFALRTELLDGSSSGPPSKSTPAQSQKLSKKTFSSTEKSPASTILEEN